MTEMKRSFSILKKDERGVASVIALLVAALLYLMGVMFLSVSSTEVTMAASRTNGLTAFYLADAGIEHVRRSLQGKDLSQVLDGTTSVFAGGNTVNLAGGSYTVQVTNNILANGFPLSTIPADPSASATVDSDGIIVVTSTGTFRNATQVVEGILRPNMPDAIVTGGNLEISGDAIVNGTAGSLHANGDMDVSGNPTISQDLTASGDYATSGSPSVGGVEGGGKPTVSIPPVNPADYRSVADYVLKADGKVYQSDGTTVVFDTSSGNSWPQNNGGWKLSGDKWDWNGNQVDAVAHSVFYVEGNVMVASNPGSSGNPWQVTLIAEGYIEISGNPTMQANTNDRLLIAGTDVKLNGNPVTSGIIAAHEQFAISGGLNHTGYIIAEDAETTDDTVEFNYMSGVPQITYDGGLAGLGGGGGGPLAVLAWHQVS